MQRSIQRWYIYANGIYMQCCWISAKRQTKSAEKQHDFTWLCIQFGHTIRIYTSNICSEFLWNRTLISEFPNQSCNHFDHNNKNLILKKNFPEKSWGTIFHHLWFRIWKKIQVYYPKISTNILCVCISNFQKWINKEVQFKKIWGLFCNGKKWDLNRIQNGCHFE